MRYGFHGVYICKRLQTAIKWHRLSACGSWILQPRMPQTEVRALKSSRGILHRIGHGEGESVGHDAEFDGEAPGRLSIHLNLDWDALFDAHCREVVLKKRT